MRVFAIAGVALIVLAGPAMAQFGGTSPNGGYGSGTYGSGTYGTGSNPNSNSVDGYTRRDGTYVQPHQRTNPNNSQLDNYGTRGNTNPYGGQTGTLSPRR